MGPLAVVGLGLIGTSIVLATRRAWPDAVIVGIDRHDSVDALSAAEIVVLAAPVDAIIDVITRHQALLRDRSLVLDTGSTKRAVIAAARRGGLHNFVGGHPMAGAASSGPSAARADLFDGRPWFLIPAHGDAPLASAQGLVSAFGARPVVMSDGGAEHDRAMAAISHLPQVVATTLMNVAAEAAGDRLDWAGGGLRDTTRLAHSDGAMWASILATNGDFVRPLLHRMADQLHEAAARIDDAAAVQDMFARAAAHRRALE
jgi:prephenate dehydrogenase